MDHCSLSTAEVIPRRLLRSCMLLLTICVTGSHQGAMERRLLNDLFITRAYNKLERPVLNESEPLTVRFGLTLQQIIDVDEKNQILISNIWLNLVWTDYNLAWNTSEYAGVSSIRVPPANIWKPDIFMYNSSARGRTTLPVSTSGIDLQPQGETGDISSFIANGEWELLGVPAKRNEIKYDCCPETYVDVTFVVRIQRRKLYYITNLVVPCLLMSCLSLLVFSMPPDAGEKITCGVTILLSLTVFLQLVAETMPPTSDAVPLIGIYFACIMMMCSISMVFTVLVLNFHHRCPDTHDMPTWVSVGVCVWLAKLVRMRRPDQDSTRPEGVRLPAVEHYIPRRQPSTTKKTPKKSSAAANSDHLLQQRSSRSLLANVLDLEDDFLLFNVSGAAGTMGLGAGRTRSLDPSTPRPAVCSAVLPDCAQLDQPIKARDGFDVKVDPQMRVGRVCPVRSDSQRSAAGGRGVNGSAGSCTAAAAAAADFHRPVISAWKANGSSSAVSQPPLMSVDFNTTSTTTSTTFCTPLDAECSLLADVLTEVQYMTGRVKQEAEMQQVCSDRVHGGPRCGLTAPWVAVDGSEVCSEWKFAAMVIDRVCLWMFSFFTVVSTAAIFLSAPNMFG